LRRELGVDARMERGNAGEFSVWVDGRLVASKGWILFPTDRTIVAAVRRALF
jgi:hypothetical protein